MHPRLRRVPVLQVRPKGRTLSARLVCRRVAKADDKSTTKSKDEPTDTGLSTPKKETSTSLAAPGGNGRVTPSTSMAQVKAIAAKISAARRLARKLAEEKSAAQALATGGQDAEMLRRSATLSAADAAAAAARADALARATKLKASTRGREAARLSAENKALLEVLTQAADGNPDIQQKLLNIRAKYARKDYTTVEEQPEVPAAGASSDAASTAAVSVVEPVLLPTEEAGTVLEDKVAADVTEEEPEVEAVTEVASKVDSRPAPKGFGQVRPPSPGIGKKPADKASAKAALAARAALAAENAVPAEKAVPTAKKTPSAKPVPPPPPSKPAPAWKPKEGTGSPLDVFRGFMNVLPASKAQPKSTPSTSQTKPKLASPRKFPTAPTKTTTRSEAPAAAKTPASGNRAPPSAKPQAGPPAFEQQSPAERPAGGGARGNFMGPSMPLSAKKAETAAMHERKEAATKKAKEKAEAAAEAEAEAAAEAKAAVEAKAAAEAEAAAEAKAKAEVEAEAVVKAEVEARARAEAEAEATEKAEAKAEKLAARAAEAEAARQADAAKAATDAKDANAEAAIEATASAASKVKSEKEKAAKQTVEDAERMRKETVVWGSTSKLGQAAAVPEAAPPAPASPVQTPAVSPSPKSAQEPQVIRAPEWSQTPAPPARQPPEPPQQPPKPKRVSLSDVIAAAARKGLTVYTDLPARPGESVQILIDKSRTVFANDDNEHHMQLKLGVNKWEEILVVDLRKVTNVSGVTNAYAAPFDLPEDLFAFDFVIQDFRSGKVDNNNGRDFSLPLTDAPSEEVVMERRLAAYEAVEMARHEAIEAAEDEIAAEIAKEVAAAAKEATTEWWRERRAELREEALAKVAAQVDGDGAGMANRIEGVMEWIGGAPMPEDRARLVYNRDASDLRHKKELQVTIGVNGWQGATDRRLAKLDRERAQQAGLSSGDWYFLDFLVPKNASTIDFVVSDVDKQVWDNNHGADFHTKTGVKVDRKALEEETYQALLSASLDNDSEVASQAGRKAGERIELRARAAAKRRAVQRRTLYTDPLLPIAGEPCDVYYNPDVTVLRGRPEVYLRGSWNRWTHPDTIPTTKLEPLFSGAVGFMKATVEVPEDALVADFVFLDSPDANSGFYDNNRGLDYHVPITGGQGSLPPLRIAHVSVEVAPIAKVGGMGDVVTALGRAVVEHGHEVEVVMPKYDCLRFDLVSDMKEDRAFNWGGTNIRVARGTVEGLQVTFLEPENGFFWVGCIYGRNDDSQRFGFFCGAALEYLKNHAPARPDVVHCHDWPTAPVAFGDLGGSRAVFTIHNLNYGADLIGQAMAACAVATTVSPTYAAEISGNPAIAPNLGKMFGVRNGIDTDIWDPAIDPFIPMHFDESTFDSGKPAAKRVLRERMNLADMDVPIVGVVTRLTHQKGIHLIKHAAWRTLERGGQFVLLGSAPDPRVQSEFSALADELSNQYHDRARLRLSFDEPLSHIIYAGCDFMLVPSMFEPCGLTQMIGMRYGTVPIVRKTGGLVDTVFDIDHDHDRAEEYGMEVNGFNFEGTDTGGLDYALNRAIGTWYNDRGYFSKLARTCMSLDWSWNGPAEDYVELYYAAIKRI